MLELGILGGAVIGSAVALSRPWLVVPFTGDAAVRDLAAQVLWFVAALQPLAAAVFVLDGILIGAGDSRYLAGAMVAASAGYAVVLAGLLRGSPGLLRLWAAFGLWIGLRWYGMYRRYRSDRWLVTGAARP